MACNESGIPLNGSRFSATNASPQVLQFQRKNGGDDLSDAGATVTLTAGVISIVLTSDAELTNTVNTAQKQEFKYLITQDQKTQLLNGADSVTVAYSLAVTPAAGTALAGDYDSDYTGTFEIIAAGTGTPGVPIPDIETIDLEEAASGSFPANRALNHLVKFINAAPDGTAVGASNPVTMASDQVWYPTAAPSTDNGNNWARLAIDPVQTGIQPWAAGLSVRQNQVLSTPGGSLVRSVNPTDRVAGANYDTTEAAFFSLVQLGAPLVEYPGAGVFLYQGRAISVSGNLYSWPADGITVAAVFDAAEWNLLIDAGGSLVLLENSIFANGFATGLAPSFNRMSGATERFNVTVTSGSVSNIHRLFHELGDQGCTLSANATIEIDFINDGANGYQYGSGLFSICHFINQAPSTSIQVELEHNYPGAPTWSSVVVWNSFTNNTVNTFFNNSYTNVRKVRLTIITISFTQLIGFRWFAMRARFPERPSTVLVNNIYDTDLYTPRLGASSKGNSTYSRLYRDGYNLNSPQTVATLQALSSVPNGARAFVSNGSRPNRPVYYNGSWRYDSDDVVIS